MDNNYLDKVLDQIIFETTIDYGKERLYTSLGSKLYSHPFWYFTSFLYLSPLFPPHTFEQHCKEVYGLNDDEVNYVWGEYKRIITEKLNNGL